VFWTGSSCAVKVDILIMTWSVALLLQWHLLFKMCLNIVTDEKAQSCPGFPSNWRFMFRAPKDKSGISDLLVIAPNGRCFRGPEKAKKWSNCEGNIDEGKFLSWVGLEGPVDFATTPPPQSLAMRPAVSNQSCGAVNPTMAQRHKRTGGDIPRGGLSRRPKTGVSMSTAQFQGADDQLDRRRVPLAHSLNGQVGTRQWQDDTVLLGKGFSREWTNMYGQKRYVCGLVTSVESKDDAAYFTVTYDEESRNLLNSLSSSCSCSYVPKTHTFGKPDVLGGHLLDNQKRGVESTEWMKEFGVTPFYVSWLVPDERNEIPMQDNGVLPALTMFVRGFHLVFTVKTSSIPNAGNGVFLTCKALRDEPYFELAAGELLDLGVYAPYRSEDRRKEHIWLLKNFVHSRKCEEFNLGTFVLQF
jgi:hypothetical protein